MNKYSAKSFIILLHLTQFDECDEATAISKVKAKSSDLPIEGNWLALDADGHDLPPDWYLRLTGEAQRMLQVSAG